VAGRVAKPLSFARRFEQDLKRIEAWYLKTADERAAEARAVRMQRVIDSRGAYLNERAKRGL